MNEIFNRGDKLYKFDLDELFDESLRELILSKDKEYQQIIKNRKDSKEKDSKKRERKDD